MIMNTRLKIFFLKSIVKITKKPFTVYSNQRLYEYIGDEKVIYDYDRTGYESVIQEFLKKRWTTKEELSHKIYIIDQLPELKNSLSQQKLIPMEDLYDESHLQKMHKEKDHDSKYIISITAEDYFKPLIDEYLAKVLVNGSMPPMNKLLEYTKIIDEIKRHYLRFFYGDKLTDIEKEIEAEYLIEKQSKYLKWIANQKEEDECIWTLSQQRRLENLQNWLSRDVKYYDDFGLIYEYTDLQKRWIAQLELQKINGIGWLGLQLFSLLQRKHFFPSGKRTRQAIRTIMHRINLYTKTIEFKKVLQIPPDFYIQHSILNVHLWLIMDRLKKINNLESKYLAKHIEFIYKKYITEKASSIYLKKKSDLIRDINFFMTNNRSAYDTHFNKNPKTASNPYYKLDALIWSTVFFEKVPRYSDIVYLTSEYFIKHYEYIQTRTLDDFINVNIEWDIYKIPVDYKGKIQKINPPLTDEEFQKEMESPSKIKRHYYSYDDPKMELHANAEAAKKLNLEANKNDNIVAEENGKSQANRKE